MVDRFKQINNTIRSSLIFRLIVMGVLVLILLIPFTMILRLVDEREDRQKSVIHEISSKWAASQVINGPVIDVPYTAYYEITEEDSKGKKTTRKMKEVRYAHFLPENLNITGTLEPKVLKRGIYKAVVYTADLNIEGAFKDFDFNQWNIDESLIHWDDAVLTFGVNDLRGINSTIALDWNNELTTVRPGIPNQHIFNHGVSAPVKLKRGQFNSFAMQLDLRGSDTIHFLPLGRETKVSIDSSWASPSFNGYFLPKMRDIKEDGFTAEWEIFDFNRDFPQSWTQATYMVSSVSFGVQLFTPVDEYQKTTRSAKYAILFIALTYLAFFLLAEVLHKRRIHPIQYLLVGFALCTFYTLLLSLSEHISFNLSYMASSVVIILLIVFYIRSIAGKKSLAVLMGGMMAGLYAFLFVILQLEDYSLLFGSIGLFIILALVMIFTRKINWYDFKLERNTQAADEA